MWFQNIVENCAIWNYKCWYSWPNYETRTSSIFKLKFFLFNFVYFLSLCFPFYLCILPTRNLTSMWALKGRRPFERPRRRWENIKIDLLEVGWGGHGLDRSGSGYGQVSGSCKCGNEPTGSIKCGEISSVAENLLASQEGLCSREL